MWIVTCNEFNQQTLFYLVDSIKTQDFIDIKEYAEDEGG